MSNYKQFHEWLLERLNINNDDFYFIEKIENEAYRICVEDLAEGNEEEGMGYWENLSDEYNDYIRQCEQP